MNADRPLYHSLLSALVLTLVFCGGVPQVIAQSLQDFPTVEVPKHPPPPGMRGSANMRVLSTFPLGDPESVSDIEIEQDVDRPYVYVARRNSTKGFDVIDISDPENAFILTQWRIEDEDLHQGGAMDGRYFQHEDRTY